jgi:hypothetical protein
VDNFDVAPVFWPPLLEIVQRHYVSLALPATGMVGERLPRSGGIPAAVALKASNEIVPTSRPSWRRSPGRRGKLQPEIESRSEIAYLSRRDQSFTTKHPIPTQS